MKTTMMTRLLDLLPIERSTELEMWIPNNFLAKSPR